MDTALMRTAAWTNGEEENIMGTTGHYVTYYEMSSPEKVKSWLKRTYTWEKWEVIDLAPGSKRRSNWWLVMEERESGKRLAMCVITSNRAKQQGMFYTKEVDETVGPHATDIPKRLFAMLTPLGPNDSEYAKEWRESVANNLIRG